MKQEFFNLKINTTGQRLITITGFLSDVLITFPKLEKQNVMNKGDLLCFYQY